MAQKDLGGKTLLELNDVFADVANVLLFKGERVILEKDLQSENAHSQYHADGKYHEQIRDVAKYWTKGRVRLALIGIESEAAPNRFMPLRVLSYDGGAYRAQIPSDGKRKKHKGKRRKKKPLHIYPAITIVMNFSTKRRWNTAKSLLEIVDLPEALRPFVNDYKVNVFDIAFLEREVVDSFESEFWHVADYFWQVRNNKDYKPGKKRVKHVREILQMMSAMTGDKRFETSYNETITEGGEGKMEEWLDRALGKSREEGERRGERRGERNRATASAKRMLKKGKYSKQEIAECLDISVKTVEKIEAKMQCMA